MIEHLLKQNADLLDRLQETIGQIHLYQAETHQKKLAAELAPGYRWDVTEDEEDATELARREDGSIDERALAQLMAEAAFTNTEVEFH